MDLRYPDGVKVLGQKTEKNRAAFDQILTTDALAFVAMLHKKFNPERERLLEARRKRQDHFNRGELPDFLTETASIRSGSWSVAKTPDDLNDRRTEITGPVDRKMMINALNSGAKVFMADLEDALSPTWDNVLMGQLNLKDAVKREIDFTAANGKHYALKEDIATLLVRPRGWHLVEKHLQVEGQSVSASLFDFGLYFFHNAKERLQRGTAPYFYLPKLESHLEARLWNDLFNTAQDALSIPRGTIRATVLIETILAAFEMDEILYELRDHSAGLNAGRWDYIFSVIKKFRSRGDFALPDRSQVTMAVPFMRSYAELLVKTCHHRGAHAIGGMAAFVPSRKDPQVNKVAIAKVKEDKVREAKTGFDGTWVAHPDLVSVAQSVFDDVLGERPHQKERLREDVRIEAKDLLNFRIPDGKITQAGVVNNISVGLQYVTYWLNGVGAAAINNLMEDAATAEISRAQLWQWVHKRATLDDGRVLSVELYKTFRDEAMATLKFSESARYQVVIEIFDGLVLSKTFSEFLTLPAYAYLD